MKKEVLKKFFSGIAAAALLINSLIAPLSVYSQEDVSVPEEQSVLTDEITPTPIESPSPTPEEEVTPSPEPELKVEVTPTPEEVTPTPESANETGVVEGDNTDSQVSENNQELNTEALEKPTSTVIPVESEEGFLTAVIIEETLSESVSEFDFEVREEGSATLVTDKPDYAPTDTVVIFGTGFTPDKEYTLEITSETGNFKFSDTVTSDESGSLFYSYQLDGTYRPNYKVELKDSTGTVIATTTFTDTSTASIAATAIANYDQWAANTGTKVAAVATNDGDTTYITNNTDTQRQSFTFSNAGVPAGSTINSVTLNVVAKEGQGGAKLKLLVEKGTATTDRSVGGDNNLTSSYVTYSRVMTSNPFTSSAWVLSEVNGWTVKFGVENGASKIARVTQLYLIIDYTAPSAVYTYTNDAAGANDEPGQKDLTLFGKNLSATNPLDIVWNWDITSLSGNNTADGCALFDTNSNGLANYALCVTWGGNQVQQAGSPTLYSCNDTRVDRCAGSSVVSPITSTCSVANTNDDPFGTGDSYPNDTRASCIIPLIDVGGVNANLLDVCSYPSTQPNSDPSDCVVVVTNKGNITIIKDVSPDDATTNWNFAVTGPTIFNTSIAGDGTSGINSVDLGTYSITETAGANTNLSNYSATWSCTKNGSAYLSGSGTTASSIVIGSSQGAEDSVVCTFTNTRVNNGSITIIKDAVPNDAQDFAFTTTGGLTPSPFSLDDDSDSTLSNTKVFSGLAPSSYTVTEAVQAGFDLTGNVTCTDPTSNSSINLGTRTATINLAASENVTCTFVNTKKGHLIVQKTTLPGGDLTSFSINTTGSGTITGGGAGAVTDTTDKNYEVTAGTYSVAETVPGGWSKTGDTCQNVVVAAGETKTCLLTNTKKGHIIVDKVTDPSGDLQSFSFTAGGAGYSNFALTDADAPNNQEVVPGAYVVSETVPAGWDSDGGVCDLGETPGSLDVGPGETVTCTFTNQQDANIVVVKETDPDGSQQVFEFDTDYGDNLLLSDGQQNDSGDLNPGVYSVSELTPQGWDLTSASCSDQSNPQSISLQAGETVTCTFTNTQRGHLIVQKTTIPGSDQNFFAIEATGSGTIVNGASGSISDSIDHDYEVTPGTYSVAETVLGNWDETSNTCSQVVVAAGETVNCEIVNTKRGHVTVTKYQDDNANGVQDDGDEVLNTWEIHLDEMSQFTGNQPPGGGQVTFSDLVPGTYILGEQITEGWLQSNISCDSDEGFAIDNDNSHPATVAPGQTTNCAIGNYQNGEIHGIKWNDVNGNGERDEENGITDWAIFIDENGNGLLDGLEGSVQTDQNGNYGLTDLIPGTYRVCEGQESGWIQTYPLDSELNDCHDVVITSGDNIEGVDFGNQEVILGLAIEKSNDKATAIRGDTVTFTLIIVNSSNQQTQNLSIIDVLPGGFTYVTGSSVINGVPAADPTIVSGVLTWDIGTLDAGNDLTIVYQAKIATDLTQGTYENLAFCKGEGFSLIRVRLLGDVECDPAASSAVRVEVNPEFGGSVGGTSVLGASISLPAAGSQTALLIYALGGLLSGILLKLTIKKYEKN